MKLFVAGCSVSDYTKVSRVYGEILAEKLGCEYVHEAAGCGSNWRMLRVITHHIMSGNLTPDDLLLVQYTGREREEFWSDAPQPEEAMAPHSLTHLCVLDKFHNDGHIIRYKAGSSVWQCNRTEIDFFAMYEKHFLNIAFEKERFAAANYMFQHMLVATNIRTIFVRSIRSDPAISLDEMLPEFREIVFIEPSSDRIKYDLSSDDYNHMNQLGHEVFAGWLYDHINKFNLKG